MCCRVLGASLVRNWDWVEIMRGVGGDRVYVHSVLFTGERKTRDLM